MASWGDLADLKADAASLGIDLTSWNDAQLQRILDAAQRWIRAFTNRRLAPVEPFLHKFNGDNRDALILREYPLVVLVGVRVIDSGAFQALNISAAELNLDDEAAIVYISNVRRFVDIAWPRGRQNIEVDYTAGFDLTSDTGLGLIDIERKVALINTIAQTPEEFERDGLQSEKIGDHTVTFKRGVSFKTSSIIAGEIVSRYGQLISTWEAQIIPILTRLKKLPMRR